MKKTGFQIQKIRLLVGTFIPAELHPGSNYITEISEEGILMYETEYKSRKQINKSVIKDIPKEEITEFFKEIYDFSRGIDDYERIVNDCSYTVTFYYDGFHKEIFKNGCMRGDEWLVSKITEFVSKWSTNEIFY